MQFRKVNNRIQVLKCNGRYGKPAVIFMGSLSKTYYEWSDKLIKSTNHAQVLEINKYIKEQLEIDSQKTFNTIYRFVSELNNSLKQINESTL